MRMSTLRNRLRAGGVGKGPTSHGAPGLTPWAVLSCVCSILGGVAIVDPKPWLVPTRSKVALLRLRPSSAQGGAKGAEEG